MQTLIGTSQEDAIEKACKHWIDTAKDAIAKDDAFYVAFSGGSTPKKIIQLLSTEYKDAIDWSKVYVFFSDERCVGPTDPQSNYKMAMDSGLSKLPLNKEQICRMGGEMVPQQAAAEYELCIKSTVPNNAFHLVMLGMGDDGHTASLFPGTKALQEKEKLVVANWVEQKDVWRLTFTFPLINQAKEVAIYVLGPSKADMLAKVFSDQDSQYPISNVEKPLWILDNESSKNVNSGH